MRAVALVVAAGGGERLGASRPKAFVVVAGRPLLAWSLDALREAGIADVVVAVPEGVTGPGGRIEGVDPEGAAGPGGRIEGAGWTVELGSGARVVTGGATRSESVRRALAAAGEGEAVVVHDAARPLVEPSLFARTLEALAEADCAVAAAAVTDTIKEAGPDRRVVATLERSRLWAIQTPQAFRRAALERALDVSGDVLAAATDDAWLVERGGGRVVVVPAPVGNFKVTTPHDLAVAELLLGARAGASGGASTAAG